MKRWSRSKRADFAERLIDWFKEHQRSLPWRETDNPYAIWISEVMLQQTQVATVVPYFTRFLKRFPTVKSLAAAELDQVLKAWEGLGYYSRARNLHRAAKIIASRHGSRLPSTYHSWLALPGIGKYTAAAISSIAFGADLPVLDGNVRRLLARLHAVRRDPKSAGVEAAFESFLVKTLPTGQAADFNQALMELGALVCSPREPKCAPCPVNAFCEARAAGLVNQIPISNKRREKPHHQVAVGLVWKASKLLISQRAAHGLLGGLWELPGGKQTGAETLIECLKRELREELSIAVEVLRPLPSVRHEYTHFKVTLFPFECRLTRGKPRALGCADWAWVSPEELKNYAFPKANHKIFKRYFDEVVVK